jgi:hypothetical protein
MVKSSIEYIDQDVRAADTEEEDEQRKIAWELSAISKLSIPILSTVFGLLFLSNVIGTITIENLYYPLFVIVTLFILLASVYVTELRKIYQQYAARDIPTKANARELFDEWKKPIGLLLTAIVYAYVIPLLGFFTASFIGMVVIARIGGYRNWKVIVPLSVGFSLLIYIPFVVVANIQPPEGLLI